MKGPGQALLVAAIIVLLGGLVLKGAAPEGKSDGSASVDNGAPRGWLALHLLLAQRGLDVVVVRDSIAVIGGAAGKASGYGAGDVILVPPPERSSFATAEVEGLVQAAKNGARVVVVCDPNKGRRGRLGRLTDVVGAACAESEAADARAVALAALVDGVPAPLHPFDRGRLHLGDQAGVVPLLVIPEDGVDDELAVIKAVGQGDIVVVGTGTLFANDGLALDGSAAFLLWLVGDRGRVVIDQRHHRDRSRAVLARASLEGPGPLTAALCLALLVPLSLLSLAPRPGDFGRRPDASATDDDLDDDEAVPAALARARALAALWALAPTQQASKKSSSSSSSPRSDPEPKEP